MEKDKILKGQEDLNEYKLTRPQMAHYLGITTNALRMRMRKGNPDNLNYRFDGSQFYFKVPKETGCLHSIQTTQQTTGDKHSVTLQKHKKTYNRGNTHKGKAQYPNEVFKLHNEMKIRNSMDGRFKNEEHKKRFEELSEYALKQTEQQMFKDKDRELHKEHKRTFDNEIPLGSTTSHGKYGTMLNAQGLENINNKVHRKSLRQQEEEHETKFVEKYENVPQFDGSIKRKLVKTNTFDFSSRSNTPGSSFFVGHAKYDDFTNDYDLDRKEVGVEFSQYELDKYSGSTERTEFKNKVEEDIYRAKKYLLKTKGSWD